MTDKPTHQVVVTGSGAIAVRDMVHGVNTYGFTCKEEAGKACCIAAEKYAKACAARDAKKAKPTPLLLAPKPAAEEAPAPEPAAAKKKKKPAKKKPKRG